MRENRVSYNSIEKKINDCYLNNRHFINYSRKNSFSTVRLFNASSVHDHYSSRNYSHELHHRWYKTLHLHMYNLILNPTSHYSLKNQSCRVICKWFK